MGKLELIRDIREIMVRLEPLSSNEDIRYAMNYLDRAAVLIRFSGIEIKSKTEKRS